MPVNFDVTNNEFSQKLAWILWVFIGFVRMSIKVLDHYFFHFFMRSPFGFLTASKHCSPRNMEIVVGMTLNSDNLEKYHLAEV